MADLEFANQAETSSGAVPHIALSPEAEAQFETITRNLRESTSTEIIRKVLADGEVVRAYWGELGGSPSKYTSDLRDEGTSWLTCVCRFGDDWKT
jgi:hypothetical protein